MTKLAIITTHPIQYHAPLFKLLATRGKITVKVFYTWGQSQKGDKYDPGFGKAVNWDIPLLEGYCYSFVENIAIDPGSHHFNGIDNPTLNKEITDWGPDSILVFGWSFKSHLRCLRYFHKRIPVFFRGDSTLLSETPGMKKIARRLFLRWVYRHVDLALYVGTQNKLYYLKHGLRQDQLIFAPHAIDNERFLDQNGEYERAAGRWRLDLNIGADDFVLLYAGKLEPVKNIDLLICAFLMIESKGPREPGIHLIIVGNGILEHELKRKYTGQLNIHFLGFQNQSMMPVVYRLGNVFVLASKSETWGLSINEAMASKRPVLVSDKSGCAVDLVENGKTGYRFGSEKIVDLADKMRLIIETRSELSEMGSKALEKINAWNYISTAYGIESAVLKQLYA